MVCIMQQFRAHLVNQTLCEYRRSRSNRVLNDNALSINFLLNNKECCYTKRNINSAAYNKLTGIYMVYNEYSIDNIRGLLTVINKKAESVFFYYDNIAAFCTFIAVYQNTVIFNVDAQFILFFSMEDIRVYFSQGDCRYPRVYLNVPKVVQQAVLKKKAEEINLLRKKIDVYYQNKDLCQAKKSLRVLICSDLFNMGTSGCMAKDYETAFVKAGIDYRLTVSDYIRFHYYEEIYFLREVVAYQPTVILGMNVSYPSFPYYIPDRLPIIAQIDSGRYAIAKNCYSYKGQYTIFILPFLSLAEFLPDAIFQCGTVIVPFVADHTVYKKYDLTKPEREKYTTDICFVGNSTTLQEALVTDIMGSHGRFFMREYDCVNKQSVEMFLREIIDECFAMTRQKGTFLGGASCFKQYITKKITEKKICLINLATDDEQDFLSIIMLYILVPVYRICVTQWVLERDYRVKLYGMRWNTDEHCRKYWCGNIDNAEELAKVYNASKIVIHSNLTHGVHRRFFEATLSGCLCICGRSNPLVELSALDKYFTENESVIYFSNKQELYEKIDYYLANDIARQNIVHTAQVIIRKNKLYSEVVLANAVYRAVDQIVQTAESEQQ